MKRRRILYVTGTRAEFGLIEHTLREIAAHRGLALNLLVTGMHLSRAHGHTIDVIRDNGWKIDAKIPWSGLPAVAVGKAIAAMAGAFKELRPDIVLVTGDRVEPFAAATAARLAGYCVAHVHGGDRAQGQLDDSLRHAISKLSHLHFAATRDSATRLYRSGEDAFRIHTVGTPGLDGIAKCTATGDRNRSDPFVVIALHPDTADESEQTQRTRRLLRAVGAAGIEDVVVIDPNNDPGWRGITRVWDVALPPTWRRVRNAPREAFLELLKAADVLIGNSSSGIIEAASFGTPVINIGDRQRGRERSANVVDVGWQPEALKSAIATVWRNGKPRRFTGRNVYGGGNAGAKIAAILADVPIDDRLMNKLIRY